MIPNALKQTCWGIGYPSATCVQRSDDSRNSAIRIAYRIWLRSSSLWEPRYPPLKIFNFLFGFYLVISLLKKGFKSEGGFSFFTTCPPSKHLS